MPKNYFHLHVNASIKDVRYLLGVKATREVKSVSTQGSSSILVADLSVLEHPREA